MSEDRKRQRQQLRDTHRAVAKKRDAAHKKRNKAHMHANERNRSSSATYASKKQARKKFEQKRSNALTLSKASGRVARARVKNRLGLSPRRRKKDD